MLIYCAPAAFIFMCGVFCQTHCKNMNKMEIKVAILYADLKSPYINAIIVLLCAQRRIIMDDERKLSRAEKKAIKKAEKQQKPKMNPADKKGVALVVALSIVALILLGNAVSVVFGGNKTEKESSTKANNPVTVSVPSTGESTTAPTTTQPSSTNNNVTQENKEPTSQEETQAKVDEKQEILDVVTKGVNSLKASDASFKGHKEQVLDMELTDCSVPSLVGIVNKIMDMFIETEIYDYDFTDGKGIDPEYDTETTTMDTFPPAGKNFSLTIDGVASAKKEQQGENTLYEVKLVPEQSTKDNPKTVYYETACDTLDLSSFELPMGEITKADLNYSGAVISVTLDKNGKVVGYHERLEISGTGEAGAIGMSGSGTVEGYIDETWTIEWK